MKEDFTKLEPHTSEWFAAMAGIKPLHAAHAATIIQKTGKKEVCTVCGDEPAPVGTLNPGLPITLRMCSDCQEIRKGTYGETFKVLRD